MTAGSVFPRARSFRIECWEARDDMAATLFLVGTPIGNLEDMTYRAVETLRSVPVVIAEDTRHTRILCSRFGIGAKLVSMPAFSEGERALGLVEKLADSGESWAMVSDAGMPGISDPGSFLVETAVAQGIQVVPIPGASAVVTALAASGLPTARFYFAGFLPRKGEHRRRLLNELKRLTATIVIYESPERLGATLEELRDEWGERRAVVCRELTKVHEEFVRGTLGSLAERFKDKPKGEITLVVEGAGEQSSEAPLDDEALRREILRRLQSGEDSVKDIARELASVSGRKKNELYAMVLRVRESAADT